MIETEFTLLDIGRLHHVTTDMEAAGVLYHTLGGNRSHIVIAHQWRHAGHYSDKISNSTIISLYLLCDDAAFFSLIFTLAGKANGG